MTQTTFTNEARADLTDIADYTENEWGKDQRNTYLRELDSFFHKILDTPHLGRHRIDIKEGIFSRLHQQHVIFYQLNNNALVILRVLHQSRDIQRAFT